MPGAVVSSGPGQLAGQAPFVLSAERVKRSHPGWSWLILALQSSLWDFSSGTQGCLGANRGAGRWASPSITALPGSYAIFTHIPSSKA